MTDIDNQTRPDNRILDIRTIETMSTAGLVAQSLHYLGMLRVLSSFSGQCKQAVADTLIELQKRLTETRPGIGTAVIASTGDEFRHIIVEFLHEPEWKQDEILIGQNHPSQTMFLKDHIFLLAACGKKSQKDERFAFTYTGSLCRACWNRYP